MPAKKTNSKKPVSLKICPSFVSIPYSRCGGCTNTLANCTCYDNISDEAASQINEFESMHRKELYCHNETKEELKGATEIIDCCKIEISKLKSDLFTSKTIIEARDDTIETICEERSTLYNEIHQLKEQNRRNNKLSTKCYEEFIKQRDEEINKQQELIKKLMEHTQKITLENVQLKDEVRELNFKSQGDYQTYKNLTNFIDELQRKNKTKKVKKPTN
jgi:uncharacterized phage infection (PIP) family protein YhgE